MKMMYGSVPVNKVHISKHDISTNDATMIASDLQSGVVGYARGQKIVGTGKAFSFASYGAWKTNESDFVPNTINVIHIGCTDYPVMMAMPLSDTIYCDFSVPQKVADIYIDGIAYPITVSVQDGEFMMSCEKTVYLQLFIGKDEYA